MSAKRPHVLLVDDDESFRRVQEYQLERAGYEVTASADGLSALERFREELHDVVISDVRMPGMDGPTLVNRLATMLPGVRIVYMSGYTDGLLEQDLKAAGRAFLGKPFTIEQLTDTLARELA